MPTSSPSPFPEPRSRSTGLRAFLAAALGAALALAAVPAAVSAAPVTFYSESFSGANGSAPSGAWTASGSGSWIVSNGKYRANGSAFGAAFNSAGASLTISTADYDDVQVRFSYSTSGLTGESLYVNYANNSGGYGLVLNQTTDSAETSTGWVDLPGATDHAGFVLQLVLLGDGGGADPAALVTIDNLEIRGEPIISDTVDPTMTVVAPASGSTIPAGSTIFEVVVDDNLTSPDDLSVGFRFEAVSDGQSFTYTVYPDVSGAAERDVQGSALASTIDLDPGDQFTWTVNLIDDAGNSVAIPAGTYTYLSAPAPTAPVIDSAAPADGTEGVLYTHTFTATGTGPISFTVSEGLLPDGVSLTGATMSGTPSALSAGVYEFDITAANGTGSDTVTYSLEISDVPDTVEPTMTLVAPSDGSIIPGPATTTYQVTVADNETLPEDITVDFRFDSVLDPAQTHTWSVTPDASGLAEFSFWGNSMGATLVLAEGDAFTWTVELTDDAGNYVAVPAGTFSYLSGPVAPYFTGGLPNPGTEGVPYAGHTFTASGSGTVVVSFLSGTVPPGLSFAGPTLSGTPTAAGSYTFQMTATSATSPDAVESYTVVIAPAAPTISGTPGGATVGVGYSFAPTLGGTGPLSVAITGTLPSGLSLDSSTGIISGTPTDTAGSYPFELTVTGATGPDATLVGAIELAPGEAVALHQVSVGLTIALAGGTLDVAEGGSLTFTAYGIDAGGNLVDLSSDVQLTSDVPTDIVSGMTIHFPTASPHAITATHLPSGLTLAFVVEVAPAALPTGALAATGAAAGADPAFALSLLTMGVLLVAVRRFRVTRPARA